MNERGILLAQIDTLLQQLQSAQETLGANQIHEGCREAAKYRFANLITEARNELTAAKENVSDVPDDYDLSGYWQQLSDHKRKCGDLFKESLNFFGGALLRSIERIDGLCKVADALLLQLSKQAGVEWNRFTILAEGSFFTEATGIIRLPFPDYSIWNLPVAVHELGHYVGPRIVKSDGTYPFQIKRQQIVASYTDAAEAERQKSFWQEDFSDLFAIYAIGPAYACACLVTAFSPTDGTACKDGREHPAHAKRAYLMLEMLRGIGQNQYANLAKHLTDLWKRNLKAAGHTTCLQEADLPQLDNRVAEIYSILALAPSVEYKDWTRASELADGLKANKSVGQLTKSTDSIADVLNAAWLWRINQANVSDTQLQIIDDKAIAMCRNIMDRPRQKE